MEKSVNNDSNIQRIRKCWYCNDDLTGEVLPCRCKSAGRASAKRDSQNEIDEQTSEMEFDEEMYFDEYVPMYLAPTLRRELFDEVFRCSRFGYLDYRGVLAPIHSGPCNCWIDDLMARERRVDRLRLVGALAMVASLNIR